MPPASGDASVRRQNVALAPSGWRILIAEALMAQGLQLFLHNADDLRVVGIASDGLEAVHLTTELQLLAGGLGDGQMA